MSIALDLQLASNTTSIPSQAQFERWVVAALGTSDQVTELSIRIVDTDESQSLNSQFRGKDRPTNVLSFPFERPEGLPVDAELDLLGDLVICAPVVESEANEQQKTAEHHWAHMVIHGTLHLMGYDHINDADAEEMESLEQKLLASLGIPDPYLVTNEV